MKPSVKSALRAAAGKDLAEWAKLEILPLLQEMRTVANFTGVARSTLSTTGTGVAEMAWTEPMPKSSGWIVEASVIGLGPADYAFFIIRGFFQSIAGTVTQRGATTVVDFQRSNVLFDVLFAVVSNAVTVTLTDAVTTPLRWTIHTRIHEAIA